VLEGDVDARPSESASIDVALSPPRRGVVVILVAGWTALAVFVVANDAVDGASLQFVAHIWVPGASWLVAGLIAWRRRPEVVIGRAMVVVGYAWFIGSITTTAWLTGISTLLADLDLAIIVWLVFAYPTGRITRRAERVYVTIVIAWIAVVHVVDTLVFSPATYDGGGMRNSLAVLDSPARYDSFHAIADPIGSLLAVGVFVLLVARFERMSPAARRAVSGLWIGSIFLAVFEIADNVVGTARLSGSALVGWEWLKDLAYAAIPIAFTAGLLGARAARGRIGRLVDDLSSRGPSGLERALAQALGDPSVQLLYLVDAGLVDVAGHPHQLPDHGDPRHVSVLAHRGDRLGVLIHDAALSEQPELVASVCAAAGMALANERLQAEVRAQLAEVRASRARIVQAGDTARRRIERNLHDGAQQRLVATRLGLRVAAARVRAVDASLACELETSIDELDRAIADLRTLARGIHPAALSQHGLLAAVDVLADRSSIPISIHGCLSERLPPDCEATAYYVIAESLTNVDRHARARRADITITRSEGHISVTVADDGVGGADPHGTGLRGLDDRVAAAGGTLTLGPTPGGGTTVHADIPITSPTQVADTA
jgi:signal transduction histidine kinase